MKLLWLCNMVPGAVQETLGGEAGSGLWIDHMLSDLTGQSGYTLKILCRDGKECRGSVSENVSFATFCEPKPQVYMPELQESFCGILKKYQPDVIHIWGTEYGHTRAMTQAAAAAGMAEKVVVSIQGLCSVYAFHYAEGVPYSVQHQSTLRDFLRQDNILQQRKVYAQRGKLERESLKQIKHIIGRTAWDRACTRQVNPEACYHYCNETLRETFYQGQWNYDGCKKHRIFASSCVYPVKGFHYLLRAFAEVVKDYPDATLAVTGNSFFASDWKSKLREQGYHRYLSRLAKKLGVADRIEFMGNLNAEKMKAAFLDAHVFALPSTIENSPNSLGEAMLLGVPCVAADVGGVTDMLTHQQEGFVYPSTEPALLAHYIEKVFAMEDSASRLGNAAQTHARRTHDPENNMQQLLGIYREIAGE